jgi:uncharacterized protein (TIGR02996 family)
MSREQELLAAVWDQPCDDAPRLAYADWLQEHGDVAGVARADFIRVQCEIARIEDADEVPPPDLVTQETRLWKKHAKTWKAGLPKLLLNAPFRRGFPHPRRRAVTGTQFLRLTLADLAPAPLWDFRINNAEKTMGQVLASDAMSRVGVLEIPAQAILNRATQLLPDASFPNLHTLSLDANWIGEAGVAALVANSTLGSLRDLSLYSSDVTDAAVATLGGAPWFPALRGIHLGNNPFCEAGLRTLVAAARSGSLVRLGVRGRTVGGGYEKRFDDATLAVLFGSPHLAGVRQLDVGINRMGDSGVALLCSPATPFRLRNLHLDNNSLTDAGVVTLAAWPGLATVEVLRLNSNKIGSRGALALVNSPHAGALRVLDLEFNPLDEPSGAAARQALLDRFGDGVHFRN